MWFTNRQLVGGNKINQDYTKINLNFNEVLMDLQSITNEQSSTDSRIDAHVNGTSERHEASDINFTPIGSITELDTQGAIEQLDTRIDTIVAQAGTDNTEIVDARTSPLNGTFATLKNRLDAHENAELPHIMDVDGTPYKYGLKQENGFVQFIYEEVI